MSIAIVIATYAAFVATVAFLWNVMKTRRYLKFAFNVTGQGSDLSIDVHVTNLTSQPLEICHLMLDYSRPSLMYSAGCCEIRCGFGTFRQKSRGLVGNVRVPLAENERAVFWLNVKDLRNRYPIDEYPFNYIGIFDSYGRIHKRKLPKNIRLTINNKAQS